MRIVKELRFAQLITPKIVRIAPVTEGAIKAVGPPIKLIIPKIVPAKFGDKSVGFAKFVTTTAPFTDMLKVSKAITIAGLHFARPINPIKIPGTI